MEITVITEEENPMLHRTDVRFRVSHAEATPDRLAVRDSLAARLNKDADEVVIRRLDTKFGMRETVGEAKVYQGADFAADVEQRHMLARNKIGDAAPEEPAPEPDEGAVEEPPDEEESEEPDAAEEPPDEEESEEPDAAEDPPDEEPEEPDAAEEPPDEEPDDATESAEDAAEDAEE